MSKLPSSFASYNKSPFLSIKHSTYFDIYDKLFSPYVGKEIVFVEIGVLNGGSLFMWRDFFGENARIIGIDFSPLAKKWEANGFEIFIGNQSDERFWDDFKEKIGPIDILLDDGGHTYEQQIITVESMVPAIKDGGLLLVEDTHTSYMKEFGTPSKQSLISYSKNIVDGMNYRFSLLKTDKPFEKNIHSVSFFESFVAFNIDRKLVAIESIPVNNGGQPSESIDFRYKDDSLAQALSKAHARLRFLESAPLIGFFARSIFTRISILYTVLVNKKNNISLQKYFRY